MTDPGTVALMISIVALSLTGINTLREPRRAKQAAVPPEVRCPCEHGINFHEGLTGRCHEITLTPIKWNSSNNPTAFREDRCTCQVYAGPELIRTLADLDRLGLGAPKDDE